MFLLRVTFNAAFYKGIIKQTAELKDRLYKLSQPQITNLMRNYQNIEESQDEEIKLHQTIIKEIPKCRSLSVLKNIALFYCRHNCSDQNLWKQILSQYNVICQFLPVVDKVESHLNGFLYVFTQLMRHSIIDDVLDRQLLIATANNTIKKLVPFKTSPTVDSFSKVLASIYLFDIQDQSLIQEFFKELQKVNFGSISFQQELGLHNICLKINQNQDFIQYSMQRIYSTQFKNQLFDNIKQLSIKEYTLLINIIVKVNISDGFIIDKIIQNLPQFDIQQIYTILKQSLQDCRMSNLKQIELIYKIIDQFDNQILMEQTHIIECYTTINRILKTFNFRDQTSSRQTIDFLKRKETYSNFLTSQRYSENTSIKIQMLLLQIIQYFPNLIYLVEQQIDNVNVELIPDTYLIKYLIELAPYQDRMKPFAESLLNKLIQNIDKVPNLKNNETTQYLLLNLISMYHQYPNIHQLNSYLIQDQIIEFLSRQQYRIILNQQVELQSQLQEQGFHEVIKDNLEITLYILKQMNVINFEKEAKIETYLIDYRIFDIDLNNYNQDKYIQHVANLNEQQLFKLKEMNVADLKKDYSEFKSDIFIEVQGSSHFTTNDDLVFRSQIKKETLHRLGLNVKYISSNKNNKIQDCLQQVLNILNEQ